MPVDTINISWGSLLYFQCDAITAFAVDAVAAATVDDGISTTGRCCSSKLAVSGWIPCSKRGRQLELEGGVRGRSVEATQSIFITVGPIYDIR